MVLEATWIAEVTALIALTPGLRKLRCGHSVAVIRSDDLYCGAADVAIHAVEVLGKAAGKQPK